MRTSKYLYTLAASALFLAGNAWAEDTEVRMEASEAGVTWENAPWSSGVPAADITALINIGDADNAFLIEGEAITGNLNLQNNTYVLLTGKGNSLTTTMLGPTPAFGDVVLSNNSIFVVSNGAVLDIAHGYRNPDEQKDWAAMSVHCNDNSQFIVDNATFTGGLYSKANHVEIRNGATWNVLGYSNSIHQAYLSVKNSTMVSQSGFGMGSGYTEANKKIFNLENSTWQMGGNGANFCGRVNVLDSAITSTGHLNVGAEGGNASGENTLFMQGSTAEKLSTMTAYKLWWNTNGGDTSSTLHQAGNTEITISNAIDSSNATNGGGNVLWLFSGNNNTFQSNGGNSSWGDNNKGVNTTGLWKITNAQNAGGVETVATNSLFKVNTIHLRASSVDGNDFQSVVDWAGESNTFRTSYDVCAFLSTGAGSDSLTSFTVRDGALADIGSYVIIGADAGLSGTASFNILNGATYNQKYHMVLQNSSVADSTGQALATIDNATWNRTAGNVLIGVGTNPRDNPNLNAVSGTSILTVKNSTVEFGGNIRLALSNVDLSDSESEHSNVSKFVVNNSAFTMGGEFYMGYGDGTTYGGTAIIEVSGENSSLISTKKGFWNGYNSSNAGADVKLNIIGKNNTVAFEGSEGGNHSFYMNSAGSGTQSGGSFKVDMQGEGNTFKVRSFTIGRTNATGGSNTVYSKGTSASNKNQILLIDSNVSIRGGAEDSTIVNTFHLDGNTILKHSNGGNVNIGLATSDDGAGGTVAFKISGVNNELYAYNFNMNNANTAGVNTLFEIEGSTHIISIANEFNFRASDPAYSTLSFVADAFGFSTIEASEVQTFSGMLEIDFTKYLAETLFETAFTLITANNSWEVAQDYLVTENNEYVNVIKANEEDTWEIVQEGNDLLIYYTSAVIPEPSTYAALFGAIALAFAAYRRHK